MQKLYVFLLAFLLAVLFDSEARAFGHDGHELVGAVADQLIAGSTAEARVKAILGSESLQLAAIWADCAKGVTEKAPFHYVHKDQYPECMPFETPTGKAAMVSFVKHNVTQCNPGPDQEKCHHQYHYADVAIERSSYDRSDRGTSDHDVVAAINACIAVLKGGTAPAPFYIRTKKTALRLLAHYVGDIHQPMHVGAVYLDHTGQIVDPDQPGFDPDSGTHGGNLTKNGSTRLHGEWDDIPDSLKVANFGPEAITLANAVTPTVGPLETWSAQWASETLLASHQTFQGVTFGNETDIGTSRRHWTFTEPAGYAATRSAIQKAQLVKAGARLAQLLKAIWP
jgi:hypothetical protein